MTCDTALLNHVPSDPTHRRTAHPLQKIPLHAVSVTCDAYRRDWTYDLRMATIDCNTLKPEHDGACMFRCCSGLPLKQALLYSR